MKVTIILAVLFSALLAAPASLADSPRYFEWSHPSIDLDTATATIRVQLKRLKQRDNPHLTCNFLFELPTSWKGGLISPPSVRMNEGDQVALHAEINTPDTSPGIRPHGEVSFVVNCGRHADRHSLFLKFAPTAPEFVTREEHLDALSPPLLDVDLQSSVRVVLSEATIVGGNSQYRELRDVPGLPPEVYASIEEQRERRHHDSVALTSSALTARNSPAESVTDGCGVGTTAPLIAFALYASLLTTLRRRQYPTRSLRRVAMAILFALLQASSPSAALETRCVWGLTTFWDSRSITEGENYLQLIFTVSAHNDTLTTRAYDTAGPERLHNLSAGDQVAVLGQTFGFPLTTNTVYFVMASGLTPTQFKVTTSLGGTIPVNITSDGHGRLYVVKHSAPGWRFAGCNPYNQACTMGDPTCCFRPLPMTIVKLYREVNGVTHAIVDTTSTNATGAFYLCDDEWLPGGNYTYSISVTFSHLAPEPPAKIVFRDSGGWNGTWSIRTQAFGGLNHPLPSITFAGEISVNGTNVTGAETFLASQWASAIETLMAFEAQMTSKHRGIDNSYDTITMWHPNSGVTRSRASCLDIEVLPNRKGAEVAHELGHVLHFRTFNVCTGSFPKRADTLPGLNTDNHQVDAPEGGSLIEGIADAASLLWAFSPDAAITTSFASVGSRYECFDDPALIHTNHLSYARNNALALWEFLDTDTSGSPGDAVDVTLDQLLEALLDHSESGGTPGENRKSKEWNFLGTAGACSSTTDCGSPNLVCTTSNTCVSGDVHGTNLRDWTSHLSALSTAIEATLDSSPCVGPANSAGDGGYRND